MADTVVQHIELTPGTLGGKARIVGHRVRVIDVVLWHERRGLSADEVVGLFPGLTLADVHAALAYYFDHREEVDACLDDEAKDVTAVRARYPSKLRSKLGV